MTTKVTFPSQGGKLDGWLAEPAGSAKHGGLVVLQEWHGVNDVMKQLVDRFADAGFLAVAPDLYHGQVATNDEQAGKLMGALDFPRAIREIGDTVASLRGHARCNGKVGVTGFCLGGALTFAAAANVEGIAAAVPFYGLPQIPPAELGKKIQAPVQAHFAKVDDWAKASVAEEIKKAIESRGGHMELHVYDAGHAFMRSTDPSKYAPEAAKLAWQRATEFLKKHLG